MSTKVYIPTPLRSYAGNRSEVEISAGNVNEALSKLVEEHPALRDHIFDTAGRLRSFINIYLNDEDIRYLSEERSRLVGRDTIIIIPAIAGGAAR
jgi:adenylyltransferase/sulfurtransferase